MSGRGAAALRDEPALGFWLRNAERQGALVEDLGDQALLLLPEHLQHAFELSEEVAVTANPDIAREDGATLLTAGHPALETAAAAVLAEGDAGRCALPWPSSRPPTRSGLQGRARELVPVEHGRVDAAGEPQPAYLPLLRVGAMIGYAASLMHRFGEQEEAWVYAETGLEPSAGVLASVQGRPQLAHPDVRRRVLPIDLARAIAAAHEHLQRRASARQASLGQHVRRSLALELQRADAYYEAALESIARRRASADADRQRMLDAQTQATRLERTRRREEIEEEFTTSHEITPFRLHLVHVPAFVLPVEVLRGRRSFPFALTWLPAAEEFAAVCCPSCGAAQPLLAGKDRLGCTSCIPGAARTPPPMRKAASESSGALAPASQSPGVLAPASESPAPPAHCRVGTDDRRPPSRADASAPRHAAAAPRQRRSDRGDRRLTSAAKAGAVERAGNKLALSLWQQLAAGERWPRKKVQRDSPMLALYRLYGQAAPMCALGIPHRLRPTEATASTYPGKPRTTEPQTTATRRPGRPGLQLTTGEVVAGDLAYPYALFWSPQAGALTLGEIMPMPHPFLLPPRQGATAEIHARLHEGAPTPHATLDAVAALLWRAELEQSGMPFAARCLATWWRVEEAADLAEPPVVLAAAVAGAVVRAAGSRPRADEAAAIYGASADAVGRVTRALRERLRLDRTRGW